MKVSVEADDWSAANPANLLAIEAIEAIREHFPDYKITMFTVPWEIRFGKPMSIVSPEKKEFVKLCKTAHERGWMKFALHGLTHLPHEFEEITYEHARKRIKAGEDIFRLAGLPLLKIFKAPNWSLSPAGKLAAEDLGYRVVEDRYYDWNLMDMPPKETEFKDKIVIAHGHIQDGDGCNNGISETKKNVMMLPKNTKFYFLDEAL